MLAYAAAPGPPSARGKTPFLRAELSATAKAVVERGFHAELPPHISTLLGLTREDKSAVMQGVLRSAGKVEGIDVAEKNHNDVVIFIVDETTGKQMLFLTSPSGALRRVLVVEKGVGRVVKPSKEDVEDFQAEKTMWKGQISRQAALK